MARKRLAVKRAIKVPRETHAECTGSRHPADTNSTSSHRVYRHHHCR